LRRRIEMTMTTMTTMTSWNQIPTSTQRVDHGLIEYVILVGWDRTLVGYGTRSEYQTYDERIAREKARLLTDLRRAGDEPIEYRIISAPSRAVVRRYFER